MIQPLLVVGLQMAVPNEASKSTTPAIRACYKPGASGCDLSYTFQVLDKATNALDTNLQFMTVSGNNLTIKPTVSTQIGSFTLKIRMTPVIRTAFEYDHVSLVVTCVITRIDPPATPTAAELKYTVNDA